MKILIWGERDKLLQEFVAKLNKEKHEVYLIFDEKRKQGGRVKGAFEEYHIPYADAQILTMIENIRPDVCMFLGDVYSAIQENTKYVSYITGLTNAILAAKQAKVTKFYYISSTHIYENNEKQIIDGTKPVHGEKSKLISSCEQICTMNEDDDFRTIILRMGEIYGETDVDRVNNEYGFVSRLANAYQTGNMINVDSQSFRCCIYYKDACELLYRILSAGDSINKMMLAAAGTTISEKEIVQMFVHHHEISVQEHTLRAKSNQKVYQSESINQIGYKNWYTLEQGIEEMSKELHVQEHKEKNKKSIWKQCMPYIETVVAFLILQLFVVSTDTFNFHEIIDVYMLFVLCIAVVFGTSHTILATIGCILIRTFSNATPYLLQGLDYYYWCLQIIMVATMAGFVKDKYKRKALDLQDETEYLKAELDYHILLNKNGQEIKEIYEERLLNYKDSFARIAEIVSELDALDSQKVIFDAVNVIERTMNCRQVCVYTVDEKSGFSRLLASSEGTENMGKTFNLHDFQEVYDLLKKDQVYVNRELDKALPMLMKATKSKTGISGILMVYDVDFEHYGQQQINTFSILCNLIEKSLARSYTHLEDVKQNQYCDGASIMVWSAYINILELYIYGESKGLLEYTILQLCVPENNRELLKGSRSTDYMGYKNKNYYYLLLTNTNVSDAQIVIDRWKDKGVTVEVVKKNKGGALNEVFPKLAV